MKLNIRLMFRLMSLVSLVMILLLLPAAVTAAPPIPGPTVTVVATKGLRLRDGASLVAPVILTLRYGEKVDLISGPVYKQGIAWRYVRVYRWGYYYDGYCAGAYLSSYGGYNPTGETGLKVTASGLRLRAGPGLWYATRRIVPYGTIVQPTGITQWGSGIQWTKVQLNGSYYWAANVYLQAV